MQGSLEEFLAQVARRGSWFGGGSVAALSAAMAAALLEKLVLEPALARRLSAIRRECVALIQRDAVTFAMVIEAIRTGQRGAFTAALKRAIEVPCLVAQHAAVVQAACRAAKRRIKPRFQSDLRCAGAIARAAEGSARTLIATNLAWLKDPAYARRIRQRLAGRAGGGPRQRRGSARAGHGGHSQHGHGRHSQHSTA